MVDISKMDSWSGKATILGEERLVSFETGRFIVQSCSPEEAAQIVALLEGDPQQVTAPSDNGKSAGRERPAKPAPDKPAPNGAKAAPEPTKAADPNPEKAAASPAEAAPAAAPATESAPAPSSEEADSGREPGDGQAVPGTLLAKLQGCKRFTHILKIFKEEGHATEEELVSICETYVDDVELLARAGNIKDRVQRGLEVMGG